MAGMISGMGFSPYAATKFAVVAMSEGLSTQLQPHGIGVSVLCPHFVRTGIGDSGRNRPARYGEAPSLDPASPAAQLVAEIARGSRPASIRPMSPQRVLAAIRNERTLHLHPSEHARDGGRAVCRDPGGDGPGDGIAENAWDRSHFRLFPAGNRG